MIRKEYDTFSEVYEKELGQRGFEIEEIRLNKLIARYCGGNSLREKDLEMEVSIEKKNGIWILEADDEFYCNRIRFTLGPIERLSFGKNGSRPIYFPARKLYANILQDGLSGGGEPLRIRVPYNNCDIGLGIARSQIKEYEEKCFEMKLVDFSEDDLEAFQVTQVQMPATKLHG